MKIALPHRYNSIPAFDAVDFPHFAVIVGLNGTGKSQLLEAIKSGAAECDVLTSGTLSAPAESNSRVVLLTNASLKLDSRMFSVEKAAKNTLSKKIFDEHRQTVIEKMTYMMNGLYENTPNGKLLFIEVLTKPTEEIFDFIEKNYTNEDKKTKFMNLLTELNSQLCNKQYDVNHIMASEAIKKTAQHQRIEPRLVTFEQAVSFGSWGEHAMFNSKLPRLFYEYRAEHIANRRKAAREGHLAHSDWLDPKAFQDKFGSPPWEQISDIMKIFGLNYRLAPPGPRDIDAVVLFFERLDDKETHVEFSSLSAGEKVLVLLSVALSNIDPLRTAFELPKLLLLDEIDASLHPAVLHQWMITIKDKVVGQMGIPCIMTTHSPITVALAPETSLFEMRRENTPLFAIPQHKALNNLTIGLPSMEVEFTQRRQVFVEADVDAEAYDRLYTLMKAKLQLSRSLNFLSTGIKNKDGVEQGTGCAAVKKVVGDLANFGSLSTFGLLDWDRSRTREGRIHVLAEGTHYAFDNVILHPLLIGLLLIRKGKPPAENLPRFVGIDTLEQDSLQKIADAVQSELTYPSNSSDKRVGVQFICNLTIMTTEALCQNNGHAIEQVLATAFPPLREFTRQRGKLALAVIDLVLGDYPNLCPTPLADVFKALSDATP